jgi:hypothetical protein
MVMKVFTKIINMQVMLVEKILRGVSSLCYLLYFHEESSQNFYFIKTNLFREKNAF